MAAEEGQERASDVFKGSGPPVFVLCNARSGSTLLRFVLDAHPDLACPPETNLPAMAAQLATVWSLIEGAPLSPERGDEPPVIPEGAIAGVRRAMDEMTSSYLMRRGKRRYCDKSLGTARFAELLQRVYPEAKFLCLYRHPMDVIASGIEACPWGLNGYGFDPYIAGTPGNAVCALARFWVDGAGATLAAEERLGDSCCRIRYEDLVANPEKVAEGVFGFLGIPHIPRISQRCFTPERERFGPADYKIWHTSQISGGSVGRGWSVPAGMIPPPVMQALNELAEKLGYIPVDDNWGTASVPTDVRAGAQPQAPPDDRRAVPAVLGDRLKAGLSLLDSGFSDRWHACGAESFTIAELSAAGTAGTLWHVDLATRTVSTAPGEDAHTAWDIVGSTDAWQAVLTGETNLGVAMRHCDLRYCDAGEAGPLAADLRVGMLVEVLGLSPWWQPADRAHG